jgi:serine protease Do
MNTPRRSHLVLTTLAALLFGFFLVPLATAIDWWPFSRNNTASAEQPADKPAPTEIQVNRTPLPRGETLVTSFAPVIKDVVPSVVTIKTAAYVDLNRIHPLFREFFGLPDTPQGNQRRKQPSGIGSGVIVSKDGYILTNHHVIDEADEILVQLMDQDQDLPAKVIGRDPRTDLAVLKVDRDNLPAATLGDSTHLEVGDIVLAIGNPFGLGSTVTQGIISAKGRNSVIPLSQGVVYQDFIQTDASINPGNSGGALIDAGGRVIGINTAIYSRTGENLGIGFAIPINLARSVMDQLISSGKVTRGYLGVFMDDSSTQREFLGLGDRRGVLVTRVEPGSPADKAGLQRDDFIVSVDGKPVSSATDLQLHIGNLSPGTLVKLGFLRGGKEKDVQVSLGERPDDTEQALDNDPEPGEGDTTGALFKGIGVRDLGPELRNQLQAPEGLEGAIVTKVEPGSPAAEAGLAPGMVILEISAGGQARAVKNAQDAIDFSRKSKASVARLYVWVQGVFRYLVLKQE